jgi:hypothetical protein
MRGRACRGAHKRAFAGDVNRAQADLPVTGQMMLSGALSRDYSPPSEGRRENGAAARALPAAILTGYQCSRIVTSNQFANGCRPSALPAQPASISCALLAFNATPTEPVMGRKAFRGALAVAAVLAAFPAAADDEDRRPAAAIQDNSFLIEEAYNQKPGEVQFLTRWQRERRDWHLEVEAEWALASQDHQFSLGVPYAWLRTEEGQNVKGFGDLLLSYRYQVWYESVVLPAFAPRLGLVLPTGNRNRGTGDKSFGLGVNLPFSKIVSDRVTLHANASVVHLFDVEGQSPTDYRLAGSGIYAVTRDFNLLLEGVARWEETVNDLAQIEREFTFTINPGFRSAVNFPDESQLVFGFSVPVTLSRDSAPDYGLFFYLSYERDFLPKRKKK